MLLGFLFTAAALTAVLVCLCTGAFAGLSWLWLLPASFLGATVLLGGLVFLFVCLGHRSADETEAADAYFHWGAPWMNTGGVIT